MARQHCTSTSFLLLINTAAAENTGEAAANSKLLLLNHDGAQISRCSWPMQVKYLCGVA